MYIQAFFHPAACRTETAPFNTASASSNSSRSPESSSTSTSLRGNAAAPAEYISRPAELTEKRILTFGSSG